MAALWWEYLQAEFGLIFNFWAITGDFSSFVDIGDSWNSTFTETASSFCLFMVLWFTFLFYDTSLNTDKCLKMKKWAGKGMQSQSWVATVEGIACLRTADCAIGFMLTQAVSKPLPGMACLLADSMACDVKSVLRLLGRNGWDCELQRHSHLSLEVSTGIGRSVYTFPDSYTTSQLYLGHCSGLWLQGAALSLQRWCNAFLQTKSSLCGQWGTSIPNIGPQLWCLPAAATGSLFDP